MAYVATGALPITYESLLLQTLDARTEFACHRCIFMCMFEWLSKGCPFAKMSQIPAWMNALNIGFSSVG